MILNKEQIAEIMPPTLHVLGLRFGTDKAHAHCFLDFYAGYLDLIRDSARKVLEIGVYHGESLLMWEKYFRYAQVIGADIDPVTFRYVQDKERINTIQLNQSSPFELQRFREVYGDDFDLIVDDGGHTMEQQQISFSFLFPLLRSGGIYILEDVHTSFLNPDAYNPGRNRTTYQMLVDMYVHRKVKSDFIPVERSEYLNSLLLDVEIWTRNLNLSESVTSVIIRK